MATIKIIQKPILFQIVHFAKQLKQSGIPFTKLIIFGSQVKGTAQPWSDIDVCVVSPSFGNDRQGERVELLKLTDHDSIDIEPHPYNPADLDEKWDPLAAEIRKFGIEIALK